MLFERTVGIVVLGAAACCAGIETSSTFKGGGVSFEYPSDWKVEQLGETQLFVRPAKPASEGEMLGIAWTSEPGGACDMEALLAKAARDYGPDPGATEWMRDNTTLVARKDAATTTYRSIEANKIAHITAVCQAGQVVNVLMRASAARHDIAGAYKQILSTLRFAGVGSLPAAPVASTEAAYRDAQISFTYPAGWQVERKEVPQGSIVSVSPKSQTSGRMLIRYRKLEPSTTALLLHRHYLDEFMRQNISNWSRVPGTPQENLKAGESMSTILKADSGPWHGSVVTTVVSSGRTALLVFEFSSPDGLPVRDMIAESLEFHEPRPDLMGEGTTSGDITGQWHGSASATILVLMADGKAELHFTPNRISFDQTGTWRREGDKLILNWTRPLRSVDKCEYRLSGSRLTMRCADSATVKTYTRN